MTSERAPAILHGVAEDRARVLAFPEAPDAIELRHLRSFVAVAEELNFGRAADRLYISQPALSRQIRALEQLMACELLRRSTHRVELTVAGEALLERARRLLGDVDEAVSAVQSLGGELVARIAQLWQPVVEGVTAEDLDAQRSAYEEMLAHFEPPAGVVVRPVTASGVSCLQVAARPAEAPAMLYLHGGGFVLGSAFGYRPLGGALALAADCGVLIPDYRLAPEHTFPAALDDAMTAYRWMLERVAAPDITVAGDSAGGALTVSLMLRLRDEGLPLPGGAVLMCPGLDMTMSLVPEPEDELMRMGIEVSRRLAGLYAGDHPLDDPLLTPLSGDFSGLPPILVQAATGDMVSADARAFAERARKQGVDVRLDLYPVDAHVFQLFWSFLPEAADALETVGEFVRATPSRADPATRRTGTA
jgi:monoterpene epsilon-lactone hydrolase